MNILVCGIVVRQRLLQVPARADAGQEPDTSCANAFGALKGLLDGPGDN